MINEAFGWLWSTAGFTTGMLIGLAFDRENWLGGYGSFRRRLVRLGHISFLGLGILNILFAHSLERIRLTPELVGTAAWALVVGGVTMPLCCGLTAWRSRLKPLFAVPVVSLLVGGSLVTWGIVRP
jgi:hypothetical protein